MPFSRKGCASGCPLGRGLGRCARRRQVGVLDTEGAHWYRLGTFPPLTRQHPCKQTQAEKSSMDLQLHYSSLRRLR
jgi:hypothetical protein